MQVHANGKKMENGNHIVPAGNVAITSADEMQKMCQ